MAAESAIQRTIWLTLGRISRLFRLNTGRAWLSSLGPKGVKKLKDGSVLIEEPRSIAIGLAAPDGKSVNGAGDLIGWTSVTVTQEMVGMRVAVFTSIECKRTKGGRVEDNQWNWHEQIKMAGGIAGIANSKEAAEQIITDWCCVTKAKL